MHSSGLWWQVGSCSWCAASYSYCYCMANGISDETNLVAADQGTRLRHGRRAGGRRAAARRAGAGAGHILRRPAPSRQGREATDADRYATPPAHGRPRSRKPIPDGAAQLRRYGVVLGRRTDRGVPRGYGPIRAAAAVAEPVARVRHTHSAAERQVAWQEWALGPAGTDLNTVLR